MFAVFHYGGLEDFILGVFPGASFDEDADHDGRLLFVIFGGCKGCGRCCLMNEGGGRQAGCGCEESARFVAFFMERALGERL